MNIRPWILTGAILAICLPGITTTFAKDARPANTTESVENLSAVVHLYNGQDQDCPVLVEKGGHSAINRACEYAPNTLLVESMPSQGTLLLSASDCSESTTNSDWWVKLQATSRTVSTERLSVQSILNKANTWLQDPSDPYVVPNFKIVKAEIKTLSAPVVRCALLQLSATQPEDVLYTSPQPWAPTQSSNAQCGDAALIATYNDVERKFAYQCANLLDAQGKPFKAEAVTRVGMAPHEGPKACPAGQLATGLSIKWILNNGLESATLTCATFKNESGTLKLTPVGSETPNRWIGALNHHNTCERSTNPGPAYLLSPPNGFMTGLDITRREYQWRCTEIVPQRIQ